MKVGSGQVETSRPKILIMNGRVRLAPESLTDHLSPGVLKKVTDQQGRIVVPDSGTGRYSVPNAYRRINRQ